MTARVLVVDDDFSIRETFERHLKRAGHEVHAPFHPVGRRFERVHQVNQRDRGLQVRLPRRGRGPGGSPMCRAY